MDDQKVLISQYIEEMGEEDDYANRRGAADILVKIGKPAIPQLIEALADPNSLIRYNASEALEQITGEPAFLECGKALEDADPDVRNAAVKALGKIGDISAIAQLVKALVDEDPNVVAGALIALGNLCSVPLGGISPGCSNIEMLDEVRKKAHEYYDNPCRDNRKKGEFAKARQRISKLMNEIAKLKDFLTHKSDILLDDKPKPPKRGMYQQARRIRNG